jgi:signal transduction histidine kinase
LTGGHAKYKLSVGLYPHKPWPGHNRRVTFTKEVEMPQEHIPEQLGDLFDMRNALQQCGSFPELLRRCVALARSHVRAQTASVYLFSKDGFLERRALEGINKVGERISDEWFPSERYAVGQSFTGKVPVAVPPSPFGRPQWTSKLHEEVLDDRSRDAYVQNLGFLGCAAAVPLNGRHRTFGVLEVVNKMGPNERPIRSGVFSESEIYWLSLVGVTTANAATILRGQEELTLLRHISQVITQPFIEEQDPQSTYASIASDLTGPYTSYKACVVRVGPSLESLEVVARAGDQVSWHGRDDGPRTGNAMVAKVFSSGQREIVHDIESSIEGFVNRDWIASNGFKSYACFPIKGKEQVFGTLSLFTGYRHVFDDTELSFIDSIVALLGSLSDAFQWQNSTELQVATDQGLILSGARVSGHDRLITELRHQHKRFLLTIQAGLQNVSNVGGRAGKVIEEQLRKIDIELKGILDEFSSAAHSAVNINYVVQGVVKSFGRELRHNKIKVDIELDSDIPRIEASEVELRDVVVNLMTNAIKAVVSAHRKEGQIKVVVCRAVSEHRDVIQLSVEDNGVGIKKEDQGKIFKYGFTTFQNGTGVGLYIAEGIVSSYDGSIVVDSNVGKGTKFSVRLPLKRLAVE